MLDLFAWASVYFFEGWSCQASLFQPASQIRKQPGRLISKFFGGNFFECQIGFMAEIKPESIHPSRNKHNLKSKSFDTKKSDSLQMHNVGNIFNLLCLVFACSVFRVMVVISNLERWGGRVQR